MSLRDVGEAYALRKKSAAVPMRLPGKRHKFNAKPVVIDGLFFASTKEGQRWTELQLLLNAGHVKLVLRQVPFVIAPPVRDEQGKVTAPAQRYLADFVVHWSDGSLTVEDVKGKATAEYLRKKRRVEALYDVKITEV